MKTEFDNKQTTVDFFKNLPPIRSFSQITDPSQHTPLPGDWWVIVTDVAGSTQAIERGEYKNVNMVGAASIIAVLNIDRTIDIPYVFGGDGATLAIPAALVDEARRSLLGVKQMARDAFSLDLRAAMFPVPMLEEGGDRLALCKQALSPHMSQAALSGRGWDKAERWLKEPSSPHQIKAELGETPEADLTGLECRWQPVAAQKDHKLSLLVLSLRGEPAQHAALYRDVIANIETIYGSVEAPLNDLRLSLNPWNLAKEARLRRPNQGRISQLLGVMRLWAVCLLGRLMMMGLRRNSRWTSYRSELVANADFRKFDGALKMVLDGDEGQFQALTHYLEWLRDDGQLVYGMFCSKQAIVTCMVFSYDHHHAHFVDGSDGGYAMAAKQLKAQLRLRQSG